MYASHLGGGGGDHMTSITGQLQFTRADTVSGHSTKSACLRDRLDKQQYEIFCFTPTLLVTVLVTANTNRL